MTEEVPEISVIIKNSNTPGSVPTAEQLQPGELALNTADQILYSKHTDDTIFSISGEGAGSAVWDIDEYYIKGDLVSLAGVLYQSLIDNNLGNNPASSPSAWLEGINNTKFTKNVITLQGETGVETQLRLNHPDTSSTWGMSVPSSGDFRIRNFGDSKEYLLVDKSTGNVTLRRDGNASTQITIGSTLYSTMDVDTATLYRIGGENALDIQLTDELFIGAGSFSKISLRQPTEVTGSLVVTDTPDGLLHVSSPGAARIEVWGDTNNDAGEEGALLDMRTDGGAVRAQVGIPQGTSNALEIIAGGDLTSASTVNSPIVFYTKGASESPKEVVRFSGGSGTATFNYGVDVVGTLRLDNITERVVGAGVNIEGISLLNNDLTVPDRIICDDIMVQTSLENGVWIVNDNTGRSIIRPTVGGVFRFQSDLSYWESDDYWAVRTDFNVEGSVITDTIQERTPGVGVNIEDVKIRDDTIEVNIGGSAKTLISKGQVTLNGVSGTQPHITWVNTSGANQWRISAAAGSFDLTEVGVAAVWQARPGGVTEFFGGVQTDTVGESTAGAGVTIDGVLLKDGDIRLLNDQSIICEEVDGTNRISMKMATDNELQIGSSLVAKVNIQTHTNIDGVLQIKDKTAFQGYDTWLRINQGGPFSSGTYFSDFVRMDGGLQTGQTSLSGLYIPGDQSSLQWKGQNILVEGADAVFDGDVTVNGVINSASGTLVRQSGASTVVFGGGGNNVAALDAGVVQLRPSTSSTLLGTPSFPWSTAYFANNVAITMKDSSGVVNTVLQLATDNTLRHGQGINVAGQYFYVNGVGELILFSDTLRPATDLGLNFGASAQRFGKGFFNTLNLTGLPVYADNTAAAALATGDVYRTATGDLKIKY